MKKAYEKPVLYIERFTLSQTIAHNCGHNLDFDMANFYNKQVCGWNVGGQEIFMNADICDFPTNEFAGVCYNAPEGGYNIFGS